MKKRFSTMQRVRSPETYFHMCDRTCTCYADDGADMDGRPPLPTQLQ